MAGLASSFGFAPLTGASAVSAAEEGRVDRSGLADTHTRATARLARESSNPHPPPSPSPLFPPCFRVFCPRVHLSIKLALPSSAICLKRRSARSHGVICWVVGACSSYPQPSCCCRARQSRGRSPAKAASRMMLLVRQPPRPNSRLQCTRQTLHAGRRDRCGVVGEADAAGEAGSDGVTHTSLPPRHTRHHSQQPMRLLSASCRCRAARPAGGRAWCWATSTARASTRCAARVARCGAAARKAASAATGSASSNGAAARST